MKLAKKNPNSSIRSGYRYEDLYVLQLCVEWLSEPQKYKSIRIQYVPEGTKGFAIDDVVVDFPDNTRSFYQLKYKQNPDVDFWTFDHLLEKGLIRWIRSYQMLNGRQHDRCYLISNGSPGADVKKCLIGHHLDYGKIARHFPDILDMLRSHISEDDQLENFFSNFRFVFNHPSKHELEEKLRTTLYEELKVTKAGVDSLLIYLAIQGSEQYPKVITLNEVRKHLSWDNPRALNQSFQVPSDFEFFSHHTHRQILTELKSASGGTMLVVGKPGAGKSTYLSKLYEILVDEKVAVFRHHYHLNPKDHTQFERLNTNRVKEALRAEFKKLNSKVLEELSWENTEHTPLCDFISKIASYYKNKGKSFVLIIDGLDHVIREGNSEVQLQQFINEIFYPQEGYWLVFGTQEMAIKCMPNAVIKAAPEEKWITIKGLNKLNVGKILSSKIHKITNKKKPIEKQILQKVFEITSGNPLHLRYVIDEIVSIDGIISTYDLDRIPPYKGDIEIYYQDLWRNLSDLAKTFCFAITALDFKLHKEQLIELGVYLASYPTEITKCLKEIRHLLLFELSGISVYHNSFSVFMGQQPEIEEQKKLLYKNIKKWLSDYNDEDLKWSELAKIEYYLGNPSLLLNIDKEWVIKSYLQCKDEDQIQNLLDLATEAAFRFKDIRKAIFFGNVSIKFANRSFNLWDDNLKKIWVTSFKTNPEIFIKYPEFSRLTYYQVKELLLALKERGMIDDIPEDAMDRFNVLFQEDYNESESIAKACLEVLMNFEIVSNQRIISFLNQFRKDSTSPRYYGYFVTKALENSERFSYRLDAIFKSKLTAQEKMSVGSMLIHDDLRNGTSKWKQRLENLPRLDNYNSKIYNYLTSQQYPSVLQLKKREDFSVKYDIASDSSGAKKECVDLFYDSLFLTLSHQEEKISQWLELKNNDKQSQVLRSIIKMGEKLGQYHLIGKRIQITDVIECINDVDVLDFYKDHDIIELRRSVIPGIITEVIWLTHVFNRHNNFDPEIQVDEIEALSNHSWYYQSNLYTLLHSRSVKLSEDAFSFFAGQEIEKLNDDLTEYKDKTERMANLAILAADLKNNKILPILLYRAAETLIAYGNHKDMLLYDILLGIEKLNEIEPTFSKQLLQSIAPYLYNIDKLTDGDETGSFIYTYSSQLAKVDVPALYNFYLLSLRERNYYLAESLFSDLLTTLDFSDSICQAVAYTAVGNNSHIELERIASNNREASQVLENIHQSLGKIDYSYSQEKEDYKSLSAKNKNEFEYSTVEPDDLKKYLDEMPVRNIYRKDDGLVFLRKWSKFWMEKDTSDRKHIVKSIKPIIQESFEEIDYEFLDYLYPYLINVDRNFAFQSICWAQSNSGSWTSDYHSKPEQARTRWFKVIKDFPTRLQEFFDLSINNSGLKYSSTKEKNYTFSAPKAIQFYIDAGKTEKAKDIAQYYIDLLPSLFPNVNLPNPNFYLNQQKFEPFDLLMRRFEWISPLVRDSAAKGLVNILSKDTSGYYHQKYLTWLSEQLLESMASQGLIILLLSVKKENSNSRRFINSKNLGDLLSLRCMATDLIAESIGKELKLAFAFTQISYVSMSFGQNSRTKKEFEEIIGRNLPLIYLNHIETLQKDCPVRVWSCWNTLFDDYVDELNLQYQRDDETFNNDFNNVMIGRATIFSEILRSTFFRLLDYLLNQGFIDAQQHYYLTISNFTIEPSIWSIDLSVKPSWWPRQNNSKKIRYEEEPPALELDISELLIHKDNQQILCLKAMIPHTDNFYHSDYYYGLSVLPFAYRGNWVDNDDAAELYNMLDFDAGLYYPEITDLRNFDVFSNKHEHISYEESHLIKGNRIIPLMIPIRSLNTNMLQYYRTFYGIKLLAPFIKQRLNLTILEGVLQYSDKDRAVGFFYDFLDGLREATEMPELLPYNSFTSLDKEFLSKILEQNNIKLGYVIKKTLYKKEKHGRSRSFDESDEFIYSFKKEI